MSSIAQHLKDTSSFNRSLLRSLTKRAMEQGVIPRACPMCKNEVDELVLHHWGDSGSYRRMCASCNSVLGKMFEGTYPSWDEQFAALKKHIEQSAKASYPNFDGSEGWWSVVSDAELKLIEEPSGLREYTVKFGEAGAALGITSEALVVKATSPFQAVAVAAKELGLDEKYSVTLLRALASVTRVREEPAGETAGEKEKVEKKERLKRTLGRVIRDIIQLEDGEAWKAEAVTKLLEVRGLLDGNGK